MATPAKVVVPLNFKPKELDGSVHPDAEPLHTYLPNRLHKTGHPQFEKAMVFCDELRDNGQVTLDAVDRVAFEEMIRMDMGIQAIVKKQTIDAVKAAFEQAQK